MRIIKRHSLLKPANNYVIDSPQPSNISYWWNIGSLLGLSLGIQIITGVTLAMHYNPNVLEAFNSVEHIMRDVNNGWLIRYLHSNTASAFFFLVYLHIGRGLYYGSYKAPRTLTWTLGTIIFILMMATAFLGYVLPYGQMSLWGATVITNLLSAIPWVGQDIVELVWGGFSVNNATLNRFFSLHFVLPFILAALALMHLIALHDSAGSNNPLGVSGNYDRVPFAPYFIFKDLITIFIFIWVLSLFVFFIPNVLGDSENYVMANPMQTPPAIVPEWYLLPFYAILRSIPNKLIGVIAMFSAILIILAMSFGDLAKLRGIEFKPLNKILFFGFVGNLLALMVLGAKHVESPFIEIGQLSTLVYFGYFVVVIPVATAFENSINEYHTIFKNDNYTTKAHSFVTINLQAGFISLNNIKKLYNLVKPGIIIAMFFSYPIISFIYGFNNLYYCVLLAGCAAVLGLLLRKCWNDNSHNKIEYIAAFVIAILISSILLYFKLYYIIPFFTLMLSLEYTIFNLNSLNINTLKGFTDYWYIPGNRDYQGYAANFSLEPAKAIAGNMTPIISKYLAKVTPVTSLYMNNDSNKLIPIYINDDSEKLTPIYSNNDSNKLTPGNTNNNVSLQSSLVPYDHQAFFGGKVNLDKQLAAKLKAAYLVMAMNRVRMEQSLEATLQAAATRAKWELFHTSPRWIPGFNNQDRATKDKYLYALYNAYYVNLTPLGKNILINVVPHFVGPQKELHQSMMANADKAIIALCNKKRCEEVQTIIQTRIVRDSVYYVKSEQAKLSGNFDSFEREQQNLYNKEEARLKELDRLLGVRIDDLIDMDKYEQSRQNSPMPQSLNQTRAIRQNSPMAESSNETGAMREESPMFVSPGRGEDTTMGEDVQDNLAMVNVSLNPNSIAAKKLFGETTWKRVNNEFDALKLSNSYSFLNSATSRGLDDIYSLEYRKALYIYIREIQKLHKTNDFRIASLPNDETRDKLMEIFKFTDNRITLRKTLNEKSTLDLLQIDTNINGQADYERTALEAPVYKVTTGKDLLQSNPTIFGLFVHESFSIYKFSKGHQWQDLQITGSDRSRPISYRALASCQPYASRFATFFQIYMDSGKNIIGKEALSSNAIFIESYLEFVRSTDKALAAKLRLDTKLSTKVIPLTQELVDNLKKLP